MTGGLQARLPKINVETNRQVPQKTHIHTHTHMHFGTNPGHSKTTRSICAMISHKDPIRNSPENITWDLASPGKHKQSRVKLKETPFRDLGGMLD